MLANEFNTLVQAIPSDEKARVAEMLRARLDHEKQYLVQKYFNGLYDWQLEFLAATNAHTGCCLCAANRIGKTYTGTFIDGVHLLGDYPDGWDGYRFSHAPLVWCLGYSGEKTRDLLQKALFGVKTAKGFTGGIIPVDRIVPNGWESMSGTSGAMRTVRVFHASGGQSICQFWSYSQGQHALMGDSVDWYHIDEEPKDATIYPQVVTRTATGGNVKDDGKREGGRGILTFTPENGRTELVIDFMENPGRAKFFMQKGWDDAPHLSEEMKTNLLEQIPPHQRDMRTKGTPMLGHGRIYDFSEDVIVCDPFEIPDHWYVINAQDFGWDHPQAHVQLVFDYDNDDFYLTHAWKAREQDAGQAWNHCQSFARGVPIAWPGDGLQHEKSSGDVLMMQYREAGFDMLETHATWPDGYFTDEKFARSTSVEGGLWEIRNLMLAGKFKVFSGLRSFFEEFNQYHRDEKGKIVKKYDDVLDAVRYAYMMRRHAIRVGDIGKSRMLSAKATRQHGSRSGKRGRHKH